MPPTVRPRWLATTLGLLAILLSLGTAGGTAAPAQAAPGSSFEQCFPVVDRDTGQIIDWICVPIPVEREICPCPEFAIGFEHLTNPSDPWYGEELARGLGLLGQAVVDPRGAPQYRESAQDAFLNAAQRLGDNRIALGDVGLVDRKHQRIEPVPEPWLESAGANLVSGVALMQQALGDPDPLPWLEAAMTSFDAAFEALHQQSARV
jgi:hypothetical protein